MKYLKYTLLLTLLYACGSKEAIKTEKPVSAVSIKPREPVQAQIVTLAAPKAVTAERDYEYEFLDPLVKEDLQQLDTIYPSSPFYMFLDEEKCFIVSNRAWTYDLTHFEGGIQYGIVNDDYTPVLPMAYDKIYNPDLTLGQCLEVKKGDKVGLFNYTNQTILPPQFDYIFPHKNNRKQVAYGLKEGTWFKIDSDLNVTMAQDFSPIELIKNLSFRIEGSENGHMYASYNQSSPNEMGTGKGVVVLPSYLEQLQLFSESYYGNIILPRQGASVAGVMSAEVAKTRKATLTDKIVSFFISVYEEGIDARGYQSNSEELVVYNTQNQKLNTYHLGSINQSNQLCSVSGYRVLFDSLIEVKRVGSHHGGLGYDLAPIYEYHKVNAKGELVPLESDRYFDFTKFARVEERHFKGCYAKEIAMMTDEFNYFQSDHLTIAELDLMRNEIFADYGYKFKTEKWKKYFASKAWYKPLHDDVNDLLTDLDKANVKTILRIKKSMEGREQKVVNKHPIAFYAAG